MNKILIIPMLAVLTIGVSQDLTTVEQQFLELLGAGEKVTLTHGQGISIWNGERYVAYGEEQIETVVTVLVPHEVSEANPPHCQTQWEGFVPVTICSIRGVAPDGSEPIWDMEKEIWTSETILEQEAKELHEQQIPVEEAKELTLNEWRIQYIENRATPSPAEIQELELRKKLDGALCMNDTLVSQKYREFEVPTQIYKDHEGKMTQQLVKDVNPKSGEYRKNPYVKDLKMQVEECIGQPFTKKSIQYDHIVVDDSSPNHKDKAGHISPYSQARVNSIENGETNVVTEQSIKDMICQGQQHSKLFKDAIGCEYQYPLSLTSPPVMRDYDDTDPRQKWIKYMEDPNSTLQEYIDRVNRDHRAKVYGGQ